MHYGICEIGLLGGLTNQASSINQRILKLLTFQNLDNVQLDQSVLVFVSV